MSQVFPTCRAPLTMSGFLRGDAFHRCSSLIAWRFILNLSWTSTFLHRIIYQDTTFLHRKIPIWPRFRIGKSRDLTSRSLRHRYRRSGGLGRRGRFRQGLGRAYLARATMPALAVSRAFQAPLASLRSFRRFSYARKLLNRATHRKKAGALGRGRAPARQRGENR